MKRKRNLFDEITEGLDAQAEERSGKRTLRTHAVELKPVPTRELTKMRQHKNFSPVLFAGYLRTNVRTVENWEQECAKPNAQAMLPIRLVQRFPRDVIETCVRWYLTYRLSYRDLVATMA